MCHEKVERSILDTICDKKRKDCKMMSLLFFYAHEIILIAVLKEEFHKVMMSSYDSDDYIKED